MTHLNIAIWLGVGALWVVVTYFCWEAMIGLLAAWGLIRSVDPAQKLIARLKQRQAAGSPTAKEWTP